MGKGEDMSVRESCHQNLDATIQLNDANVTNHSVIVEDQSQTVAT